MNAAEITDKLGLHSLRQRAWVCHNTGVRNRRANSIFSIFNRLALLLVMVYMRDSNG